MDEKATRILCECDPSYDAAAPAREWCGRMRGPEYFVVSGAAPWEIRAAEALARGGVRRLVMALDMLDRDGAGHDVTAYSNLGQVSADRDDYGAAITAVVAAGRRVSGAEIKERAERRHARREAEALDEMLKPCLGDALRRRLVVALRAAGVDFRSHQSGDPDNPCLYVAREAATLLRSWDTLRHYPEHAPAVRDELLGLGIRV